MAAKKAAKKKPGVVRDKSIVEKAVDKITGVISDGGVTGHREGQSGFKNAQKQLDKLNEN